MQLLFLIKETFVVAHEHLSLQGADCLKCNADNDYDGGAAKGHAGEGGRLAEVSDENRHNSDDAKVDGAEEGDLVKHLLDELAGGLAGTEARDVAAVLLQIIGHFNRVELDGRVEIGKEEYQQEVDHSVGDGCGVKGLHKPAVRIASGERRNGGRQGCNGLGKDYGHDAGHVHLHGQMRALAAVHLAAHHALSVLDRDSALGVADKNDQDDDRQGAQEHQHSDPPLELAGDDIADTGDNGSRQTGHDAGKEDDGNTVADAEFGDLLAKPHNKRGAGGKGQNDDNCSPDAVLRVGVQQAVVLHEHVVSKAHEKTDAYSGVAGDGGELLLALLALFLLQPLQSGDRDAKELDDNGSINVGLDGQGENRRRGEGAAGHYVVKAENGVLQLREVVLQGSHIHIRDGDGVAETVKQDYEQSEEYLPADLLNSPRVTQSLKHLDHLCLSAGRLDFLFRGFGESSSFNSKLLGNFAVAKELYAIPALGEDACVQKSLGVHNGAVLELVENSDVDRLQRLGKDIVEASLGYTAGQRHLAALKADAGAAAAAGLLALVAAACGLAVTGGVTSALALVNMGGAGDGRKFVNIHSLALLILLLP